MVQTGEQRHAMAVDRVVGIQQVVVRSVDGEIGKPEFVVGGAVMGDGKVAMVVDVGKLFSRSA
jgi:two-component system, chemotaxis family, sensor kinase CheA